ncbi:MAG: outer membrane beta-barrel protein [Bdellovibrionales bacterium]|nr:outer membrane beta-barrel protein [Bdellovibrionales bacterium]
MKHDSWGVEKNRPVLGILILFMIVAMNSHGQFGSNYDYGSNATQATGFRLGKWRLHAALSYLNGYDSNVLFDNQSPEKDLFIEVTPGADLIFQGVRTNFLAGYRFKRLDYLEQSVQDYNAHNAFFRGGYRFFRGFSLGVEEFYERSSDPADDEIPERVGRTMNRASIEVVHQTPAKDLETKLKYANIYQKFDAALASLSYYNNKVFVTSRLNLLSRFRFLPKSTLIFNGEYGFTDFNNNYGPGQPQNYDSQGWSAVVGLSSQITRKINLLGQVGGSMLYFDQGPGTAAVIGLGSFSYTPSQKFSLIASYQRKVEESSFTNYFSQHAFELQVKSQLTRRLHATAHSKFSFIDFSGPNVVPIGVERSDSLYQAGISVIYLLRPWVKPKVIYNYSFRDSNSTNFLLNSQSADFSKHIVALGIDLYY